MYFCWRDHQKRCRREQVNPSGSSSVIVNSGPVKTKLNYVELGMSCTDKICATFYLVLVCPLVGLTGIVVSGVRTRAPTVACALVLLSELYHYTLYYRFALIDYEQWLTCHMSRLLFTILQYLWRVFGKLTVRSSRVLWLAVYKVWKVTHTFDILLYQSGGSMESSTCFAFWLAGCWTWSIYHTLSSSIAFEGLMEGPSDCMRFDFDGSVVSWMCTLRISGWLVT